MLSLKTDKFVRIHETNNPVTPGRAIWPNDNIVKDDFSGGRVQNIVFVPMAVLYNSLHFHLIYLNLLPPEKCKSIWVPTVK